MSCLSSKLVVKIKLKTNIKPIIFLLFQFKKTPLDLPYVPSPNMELRHFYFDLIYFYLVIRTCQWCCRNILPVVNYFNSSRFESNRNWTWFGIDDWSRFGIYWSWTDDWNWFVIDETRCFGSFDWSSTGYCYRWINCVRRALIVFICSVDVFDRFGFLDWNWFWNLIRTWLEILPSTWSCTGQVTLKGNFVFLLVEPVKVGFGTVSLERWPDSRSVIGSVLLDSLQQQ